MFANIKVTPPNRDYYFSRCLALQRHLADVRKTPTVIIADACWSVLREAFGGQYRAFFYVLIGVLYGLREDILYLIQYNWHMYVRLRTREETAERMFQTPVDVDSISRMKNEEELKNI